MFSQYQIRKQLCLWHFQKPAGMLHLISYPSTGTSHHQLTESREEHRIHPATI